MKKLLLTFISDIWKKCGFKMPLLIFLVIANGLTEGVGIALLLPLLALVGIGGNQEDSPLALLFKKIFNELGFVPQLPSLLLIIIAIFILQNSLFICQSWLSAHLQHNYVARYREYLFSKYMRAGWPFFIKSRSGNLINTIIGETDRLGGSFYLVIQLFSAGVITIIYMSLSFYTEWRVTTILIISGVSIFLLTRKLILKGYQIGKDISIFSSDLQSVVNEFIGGAKIIKATSTAELAGKTFTSVVERLKACYFWSSFNPNILKAIFELSSISLLCVLLYLGIKRFQSDPAVILVVIAIFVKLIPKMFSLHQNLQLLGVYLPSINTVALSLQEAEKYEEILDTEEKDKPLFQKAVNISIRDVSFSYSENQVLHDISIEVPAGKTVAIVGGSGSGKSTLVDCLLRLLEPQKGSISVEGIPLHKLPLHSWRKCVGYVLQETFLFHDSIRNNIFWGSRHREESELIISAQKAYIHDFIMSLPEGYNTIVGDRGVRLSGGEKQRIGLARALINRPCLLILDEATSGLDSESEQYILKAIEELHGQMTIITIAHRLSTVRNADYIYVLENGRIIEQGTWKQLIEQRGRFYQLLKLQNTGTY